MDKEIQEEDVLTWLYAIARGGDKEIFKGLAPALCDHLPAFGIDTDLRVAHFLAQAAHESDGFRTMKEYASGKAYEGRLDLGNVRPGDGVLFKGRGIFQLTGRANYRNFGNYLKLPLEQNPELASTPDVAVQIACAFWKAKKLNVLADADDIIGITKKINGGRNGLESRRLYLQRAKKALGL